MQIFEPGGSDSKRSVSIPRPMWTNRTQNLSAAIAGAGKKKIKQPDSMADTLNRNVSRFNSMVNAPRAPWNVAARYGVNVPMPSWLESAKLYAGKLMGAGPTMPTADTYNPYKPKQPRRPTWTYSGTGGSRKVKP